MTVSGVAILSGDPPLFSVSGQLTMSGLTLVGKLANSNQGGAQDSLVIIQAAGSLYASACTFENNTNLNHGGGAIRSAGSCILSGCQLRNVKSNSVGGGSLCLLQIDVVRHQHNL